MKTFLKIFSGFLIIVLISMITIPIVFKNQIIQKVKEEINKSIRARVDWKSVSLSMFRSFPDLGIRLDGLSIAGIENFEGDTLISFDKLKANIDLFSIFSDKIKVKTLFLDRPVLRALISEDGSVNWDIFYPSDEIEEVADTSDMELVINLKKIDVINGLIHYFDEEINMGVWLDELNMKLSGDFSEKWTELAIDGQSKSFTVDYKGIKYINNAVLDVQGIVGADLEKYDFTFRESEVKLNDLLLGVEGMLGLPDDDIVIDINYFSKDSDFKSLLSVVPAIYSKDFEKLQTSGSVEFQGNAIGRINDDEYPKVNIHMLINEGYFSYPDLPKSVDNVNAEIKIFYDGVLEDNSTIDIEKFHLNLGGNPLDMYFKVITPISDMQLTGAVKGKIDLSSLADVIPLEETELNGLINANLEFMGKLSDIENENYQAFMAEGALEISDLLVRGSDIPLPVKVERSMMDFSPQYVNLSEFDAIIGSSDIHLNGRLENFIPYIFTDETIKGKLDLKSGFLNLNELMSIIPEDSIDEDDDIPLSVPEIPKNILFAFNSSIDKIKYDKLEINNLKGSIEAREGILVMKDLSMDLLEGSMIMSGEYNTAASKDPLVDFDFNMNKINIPSAFKAFNTVEKLVPIAEYCIGNISMNLSLSGILDSTMNPVLSSLLGNGRLRTDDVEIVGNNTFDKISKLVNNEAMKNPKFRNVNLSFDMRNGRLFLTPFDTKVGSSTLNIGGDQGIDQTMNYYINMSIPKSEFGESANDFMDKLAKQAVLKGFDLRTSENVNFMMKIGGTFSDPKFSLDIKESMRQARADAKEAVQKRVEEELEDIKADVKAQISEEINRIMLQAREEADKIRQAGRESGEKLIDEAKLQGNNLIKEAGTNPIKKLAAQKAAEELEKAARAQADRFNKEADQKATKLLHEAQIKADALNK